MEFGFSLPFAEITVTVTQGSATYQTVTTGLNKFDVEVTPRIGDSYNTYLASQYKAVTEKEQYTINSTYQPDLFVNNTAPFDNDVITFSVSGFPAASTSFSIIGTNNYGSASLSGGSGSLNYTISTTSQMYTDLKGTTMNIYAQDNAGNITQLVLMSGANLV